MMAENDGILRIERKFAAAPERVFAAWTNPEELANWWGPEGMTTPQCKMDVRTGGAWQTTMRNDKGDEYTVSGVYRTIDPPRHLVFTWAWHNDGVRDGHETEISVQLEPVDGGTHLVLIQQTFAERDQRDNHHGGWMSSLNDLARFVENHD